MSTYLDPRPVPTPVPIPEYRQRRDNLFRAYSGKERRLLTFESELEYRVFLYYEGQPAIDRLCEQALKIEAQVNGKKLVYTFDLWLRWKQNYEEYLETKPYSKLKTAQDGTLKPAKWDEIEVWCINHGAQCRFITDKDLVDHVIFIDNWIQAMPYVQRAQEENNHDLAKRVLHFARQGHSVTLRELETYLSSFELDSVHATVFLLIHQGTLKADMASRPINRLLEVEVVDG